MAEQPQLDLSQDPLPMNERAAVSLGWLKRSEIGPDVWEQPNGQLRQVRFNIPASRLFPRLAQGTWIIP